MVTEVVTDTHQKIPQPNIYKAFMGYFEKQIQNIE
tara:strand:+ start:1844 stop:1948 length:105 start_codon:yes stop_codon:yes gene_type:complete